jgi:hypothetical protein
VEARAAVRAGVRLDDFLRDRLARYAERLPVPLADLPVDVVVEDGDVALRARPVRREAPGVLGPRRAPATEGGAAHLAALVAREGAVAAREIRDVEERVDVLAAEARARRSRVAELERALADDLAAGALPTTPRVVATPEQLGRPAVPHPALPWVARTGAGLLVAAEALAFAGHGLSAAAGDLGLRAALEGAPVAAGLALALAAGGALAATLLARAALRAAEGIAAPAPGRRGAAALAGGMAGAAAVGIAALAPPAVAEGVLLAAAPVAAAVLLAAGDRAARAGAAASARALEWDRARAADAALVARRLEGVLEARAGLAEVEAERAAALARLRALEARAVAASRAAEDRVREEGRARDRLVEALAGALERDRYLFLRLASAAARGAVPRPAVRRLEPAPVGERLVAG